MFAMQSVLYTTVSSLPLPGAIGISETVFLTLYSHIYTDSLLHDALLLHRGISFYIFQTMSYTIDLYRNKISVEKNFLTFLTYVSMFPQLVAGPIVRYEDVSKELKQRKNGLLLSDEQIEILKNHNINYEQYQTLSSLIFAIEEYINDVGGYMDITDIDELSKQLAEQNYYNNTNK